MSDKPAITLDSVTKRYDATIALDEASLTVPAGEVHALLGENGAGKSTAVKLLSGFFRPDSGTISVFGEEVMLRNPREAHARGIQTAFQELLLVNDLTVAQNMLLPYEPRTATGQLRGRYAEQLVSQQFQQLDLDGIDPRTEVRDLDLPQRQKIGIAKAVIRNPRILLLDEPTSALSGADVDWLSGVIDKLRKEGVTILFVTHRMREVRRFCSGLSVLRNGQHVGTFQSTEISDEEVIRLVIGRSLAATFPPKETNSDRVADKPILAGKGLATGIRLKDASFGLWQGEVLGIAGLEGMGQRDLFLAMFGMMKLTRGTVELDGVPTDLVSPVDAVKKGISLVPEDRKTEGILVKLTGRENVSLPVIDHFSHAGWIDMDSERAAVDRVLARVNVHPRAMYTPASAFSGGNQQKISIAKWLMAQSRVLLMFDPTRGVDVGTKHEIYLLIHEFAKAGGSVLFYSTEIPEIVNLCNRVLVMYDGHLVDELSGEAVTEEAIMSAALGGKGEDRPADRRSAEA